MLKTENEEQYIWRIGQAKDAGEIDLSWEQIADLINKELYEDRPLSEAAFRKPYQSAKRFYEAGVFQSNTENTSDTVEATQKKFGAETSINKDGTYSSSKLLAMNEDDAKNPRFLLKAHGFDPDAWEIVSARNNIRQVVSKQDGVVTLYASFLTVKPVDENKLTLDKIDEFFNRLDRNYSSAAIECHEHESGKHLLLIDIADLHLNLQASMFTTGNEYNCDIAEDLFYKVIGDILARTEYYNFDEVVFTIGGDMLNGDYLSGSTTKGTPQVSDVHYYDAYERLCAMTIKAIEYIMLKAKCKIHVIYVMGNHDEMTCYKLAKYVDAWFRNDPLVVVDYQPVARKYKLFGKTLMCFAHDGKIQKLPAIIADEARKYWSQAEMVEVFLQHMHTEQVLFEENNIRIQRLPTISARSKWSADEGYNSKRQCKSFVFDDEWGLTDVLYTPIQVS